MRPPGILLSVLSTVLITSLIAAPPDQGADKVVEKPRSKATTAAVDYEEIRNQAIGQKFETFKVRAKTYNNVLITGIDDIGVKIRHEAGTARLKFVELPASMRKQFGYNPAASAKARKEEKARENEPEQLSEEDRKRREKMEAERRAARSVLEKEQEKIKAAQTIKVLESKIRRLKLGTSQARAEIEGLRGRANRYRSEATYVVSRTDRNGNIVSETRVSKGKLKMADNYDQKAEQERVKIDVAKDMMNRYDDEIRDLRRLLKRR